MGLLSTIALYLKAYRIRFITAIFFLLERRYSYPLPPSYNFKIQIPVKDGKINIFFYTPAPYKQDTKPIPVIVNFHGGGWLYGTPENDARFAAEATKAGYVVASVGYRRCPEHVYPTQLNDCVEAILWLKQHAAEYNLGKMVLCGWSAGGNLAVAAALKLQELKKSDDIELAGILSVYPLLDFVQSHEEKERTCPIASEKSRTPKSWKNLNQIYVSRVADLASPFVSPALASDEALRALPKNIALYTVEWDHLREEVEVFRHRLKELGKVAGGYCVEQAVHAWDKFPTFKRGDKKRDEMYADAVAQVRSMVEL